MADTLLGRLVEGIAERHHEHVRPGTAGRAPPQENRLCDHGVIGDLRSAAMVGRDGTISFFCAGGFDQPTIFASLLDPDGGCFSVRPTHDGHRTIQMYLPDTNVLLTRFLSDVGIAELTDFMPLPEYGGPQRIVRTIRVVRGTVELDILCAPRPDYGAGVYAVTIDDRSAGFAPARGSDAPPLRLRATMPLSRDSNDVRGRVRLEAGQQAALALEIRPDLPAGPLDLDEAIAAFEATSAWWHGWLAQSSYDGRWREMVSRSVLTLKLMTSAEHGAMVAAVTFGLPEQVGGERNWDYRYCWVRDTSFAMFAFVRLGFTEEAIRFTGWIGARLAAAGKSNETRSDGPLRVMYSLDGDTDLPERTLPLRGYMDSRPVRVGNGAAAQFQLDIYGELLDAGYLADKYGRQTSWDGWGHVCAAIDWLRDNWTRADRGIWEGRGEDKHFLHSRLMCWVAVDRAIRLAQARSMPAQLPEWNQMRLEIHHSIHREFWNDDLRSFVQYPGATTVDGSMLLMPLVRFIAGDDPRWLGTLDRIEAQLVTDCLVRRRSVDDVALDGLDGEEGAFLACSFWYVEALARAGRLPKARLMFEKLLGYANHLGLYSEELSPTGEQLGNTPQVLTHLALISCAAYLSRALKGPNKQPWT